MNKQVRLKDFNGLIFTICLVVGSINACLGNIAPTIFAGALMISCLADKSGYITEEVKDE
jgi:hypothetical protein